MRVLVCPTAFKGTLTAAEAAAAVACGVRRALPETRTRVQPLSDGGPGLIDALQAAGPRARVRRRRVRGPLGEPVAGRLLSWRGGVVVETADACGVHLVRGEPRPLEAHTGGVGDLVRAALRAGAARVVVGLGGSATTDGGTGMAGPFGYRFLDRSGRPLPPGGGALRRLARIEPGRRPDVPVTALADVGNPLTGMRGAARAYGPQKGADADSLELLVRGLERLDARLREDLGADVGDRPGSGAAGGMGAGCAAFLGAELVPGSQWVLDRVGFDEALREADAVATGEGAWDATSREGKIVDAVLSRARAAGVVTLLLCGRIDGEPPHADVALDGRGAELDAEGLAGLAARGCRRLVGAGEPGERE